MIPAARLRAAGACLVLAPALLLASAAVLPPNSNDVGAQLEGVARHPDRFLVSDLLGLGAQALLVPAVLGLVWLLRERGAGYGHVGGGLVVLGVTAAGVQTGLGLVEWQMVAPGADRAQMTALLGTIEHSAGLTPILLAVALLSVGFAVLALGLHRARAVPAWAAASLAVGAFAVDVGYEAPSFVVRVAASALTFVALAAMGREVLRAAAALPPSPMGAA